ncbi:UNVERIFIED_CONTAM: hypothetical protein RMT77_011467 [Armadillidium vulgare]
MEKQFKNFDYDLSQNLVHYKQKELVSLYDHSLILSIAYIFKDSEIVEAMEKAIDSLEGYKNFTDNDIIALKELELKTSKKFVALCELQSINKDKLHSHEDQIHNLLIQILDIFIEGGIHNFIDLNQYLKNFTFTSQGTVNLKKTILRILQESTLTATTIFEVECHFFIENSEIHNLFHTLKHDNEKVFLTSNFIKNYSLYYWMWQIYGTRELVTKICSFHIKSDTIWSRTDVDNDVALVSIFQEAVRDNNELAVQYLWDNHISKMTDKNEKLCDALQLVFLDETKINICLYLLFQLQKFDLIESNLKCLSHKIMKNIVKNNRWHCLFIDIFEELKNYLSLDNISEVLYDLIKFHCQDYPRGISYNILFKYSRLLPENAISKVISNENFNTLIQLIIDRNELINILLTTENKIKLKTFLCSSNGLNFFTKIIKEGEFEFLDKILKSNFEADDMKDIKLFLNHKYVYGLCSEFVKSNQLERMFLFLEWWTNSLSTEQIQSYKNEIIAYDKIYLKMAFQVHQRLQINSVNDIYLYLFWSYGLEELLKKFKEKRSV